MKTIRKKVLAWILTLAMATGILSGMEVEVKAADNSVVAGPFTLSRESSEIVEGTDYEYKSGKLTILSDGITIGMSKTAEPTSDIIQLGEFNNPPLDLFRNVTFSWLKLKNYAGPIKSYVDTINITLIGNNEVICEKSDSSEYGSFAIYGYGDVHIKNSPSGALFATGDGLGWGAISVTGPYGSAYGKNNTIIEVASEMPMYGYAEMVNDITEADLSQSAATNKHYIKVSNGYAKTVLIGTWQHVHKWQYSVNGDKLSAACNGYGSCDYNGRKFDLTIASTSESYDGYAKGINIQGKGVWEEAGIPIPTIVYYLRGTDTKTTTENSGAVSVGAQPKEPGKYTGRITVDTDKVINADLDIQCTHDIYNKEVVGDKYLASAATCTKAAKYYKSCACGEKIGEENFTYGEPLGHDFSNNAAKCRREGCDVSNPDYKAPQPEPPAILEGANGEWVKGSVHTLRFRSNAEFSHFLRVEVDGVVVDGKNYIASQGSTIVELNAEYLGTLSAGIHTITIVSTDGSASATFTVREQSVVEDRPNPPSDQNANNGSVNNKKVSPKTNDDTLEIQLFALMFALGVGLILIGKKRKEYIR